MAPGMMVHDQDTCWCGVPLDCHDLVIVKHQPDPERHNWIAVRA